MTDLPFHCGMCGVGFASKGDKRRHKRECRIEQAKVKAHADREWAEFENDIPIPRNLDEFIAEGRMEMGPARWAELQAEWEQPQ